MKPTQKYQIVDIPKGPVLSPLRRKLHEAFTSGKALLVARVPQGRLSGLAYYEAKTLGLKAHTRKVEGGHLAWASKR